MQFQIPAYDSLLSTLAVVTTVLQYLSGAIVCRKYIQKKSTGDSSGFPFACGFLSCSFWLRYGFYSNEQLLVLVNTIGASLFLVYVVIYYVFTVNKKAYIKHFAVILTILFGVLTYTSNMEDRADAMNFMGYICCIATVCFFSAPLTMLVHVVRVKNSESLPFPLIAMSFVVSLLWLIYGIVISDTFIQIPNFMGCVLSMLQLCLFVCYPPRSFAGPGYKLVDQTAIY